MYNYYLDRRNCRLLSISRIHLMDHAILES